MFIKAVLGMTHFTLRLSYLPQPAAVTGDTLDSPGVVRLISLARIFDHPVAIRILSLKRLFHHHLYSRPHVLTITTNKLRLILQQE